MPARADLVSAVRLKTGYPERGANGTARIVDALKHGLREMWGEMPEGLLQEEWRFRLEPKYSSGTLSVDTVDPLTFQIVAPTVNPAVDGTLRARWLEINRGDSVWHRRRIRDVFLNQGLYYIVVDDPWDNLTDTGMSYNIYTYEYPYPGDVQKVRQILRDPDNQAIPLLYTLLPDTADELRLRRGWRSEGDPRACQRGDFYQLPAPHYTPTTRVEAAPTTAQRWGHDSGTTEQVSYGPAGTFEYRVCHVWGRRTRPQVTQENILEPFYISSPSPASTAQTTTWNGSYIEVETPDLDYVYGYGIDTALRSYHHHGTEKWIFRRRTATEDPLAGTNNATHKYVEADSIYYLWRITVGHITNTYDRGEDDPVDKRVQLYTNNGHFHLRFDSRPTVADDVLLRMVRRPPNLDHDADAPRIPPEATDALIFLACSYLVGERDGNPSRTAFYRDLYNEEMDKLRSLANAGGFVSEGFGDGLSHGDLRSFGLIPGAIREG